MPQRQVFLDTETTGFNPKDGHRVLELALIEAIDGQCTGREFHTLINPDRDVPAESTKVHGQTWETLRDQPRFRDIAPAFIDFIRGAEVLAHNSGFDEDHLNSELVRMGHSESLWEIAASFTDTLALSRRLNGNRVPNHKLDTLLDDAGIDRSERTVHTALLDTRLLVQLYARWNTLHDLKKPSLEEDVPRPPIVPVPVPVQERQRVLRASAEELARHNGYLDGLEAENKQPPLARQPAASSPRPRP